MHNIGPHQPMVGHSQWLAYLGMCAAMWEHGTWASRPDPLTALRIRQKIAKSQDEARCEVCQRADKAAVSLG